MATICNFVGMFLIGWIGSLVLLLAFENEHPKCLDSETQKQINQAVKKLSFRAGLIVAAAWLMYHWTPVFGD